MIDPLLSLAFGMQSNRGVYALLLGSGVSRAAQIPTGWEIVLDLVGKLAHMQGEECPPDPAAWYRTKFGDEPDYSKLLDAVAKSPVERQQLLATYFEPNEEEREQGWKLPTCAHRAIAKLVSGGYVRVILTTNFDRLIERAIEDEGITPAVISTPDATEGALPVVHQKCCVIKLHGDYLDTRIKNTPEELASYDTRVNHLLDRVLDEFGCVFCGWSAQWDEALCAAIDRCNNRRFTTYWAARGKLGDRAERLVKSRAGVLLTIKDADTFFTDLSEKVTSLEEMQRPHPLSVAAAAATVKRLLADPKHIIRLHDLVREETERACASLQVTFSALLGAGDQKEKFQRAVSEFSLRLKSLRVVCMYGAYWGKPEHQSIFPPAIQRLTAEPGEGRAGAHLQDSLRVIPSLILLYTTGIAALANNNIEMLCAFLKQPTTMVNGERRPFLTSVDWYRVGEWFKLLHTHERDHFPASEWLFIECREIVRPLIADDSDYDRLFDLFEFVRSLAHIDLDRGGLVKADAEDAYGPPGRFVWKYAQGVRYRTKPLPASVKEDSELVARIAKAGMFRGKADVVLAAIDKFEVCMGKLGQRCW